MIELKSVTKKYAGRTIVDNVCCTYEDGKIYGLTGYNGSGKTTLLKTVAGIFRPESGVILADGQPTHENENFRMNSFLMTEELFFDPQSTPFGMSKIYKGYYPTWNDELFDKLLEIFGLEKNAKIAGFSKGMQRQTGLALALSVMPRHLFLDETFDGLDIVKRRILAIILRQYTKKTGALVIVTSHYLSELQNVADEIGMIDDGKFVVPDTHGESLEKYFADKSGVDENEISRLFG